MNDSEFKQLLSKGSRSAKYVEQLLTSILETPNHVLILIDSIGEVDRKDSAYAARVLELAIKMESQVILPYLDEFCQLIKVVRLDASIRACAKIIEILCVKYYVHNNSKYKKAIHDLHKDQFTETCFDWMIGDKATAIQAHSMYALYLLGADYEWIYSELIQVINKSMMVSSIGYQNRGKKIISAIQRKVLLKLY